MMQGVDLRISKKSGKSKHGTFKTIRPALLIELIKRANKKWFGEQIEWPRRNARRVVDMTSQFKIHGCD